MSLAERIALVNEKIAAAARQAGREPSEVTLVAATKVQTSDTIRQAIAAGVTICGENRVQEMTAHLDDDAYAGAALHFIGHLQTNKVKQVVGHVDLIQSVGSAHLLQAIQNQADKQGLVQDILQERHFPGGAVRPGRPGGWQPPCAPAGAHGNPSRGRRAGRKPPVFYKNASALC